MTAKPPSFYHERQVDRALATVSDTNRLDLVRYIEYRQLRGVKVSTIRNYARWLQQWDAHLAGKTFRSATPDDAQAFLVALKARGLMPYSLLQAGTYLIAFYRWASKGQPKPEALLDVLRLRAPQSPERKPVTDEEMEGLLQAATNLRDRALVALLRDTGFRISELLALNVGSVTFEGDEWARLELPRDAPGLKTGARTIYVQRSLPLLKAVLLRHLSKADAEAPLFVSNSARSRGSRLTPGHVSVMIRRLCRRAGVRHMSAHYFRHTRATEAAREGWNEAYRRQYFGWAKGSKMPAHYTHLTPEDVRDLMERRWQSRAAPVQPQAPADLLGKALADLLRRGLGSDEGAPAAPLVRR